MSDVTRILSQIESGDPAAAEQLLPLVYDELRRLAAAKLAQEQPGQTLDATALVHEAYLRLAGNERFEGSRHFFAAAAEAMRRILVDQARKKRAEKHGGQGQRFELSESDGAYLSEPNTVLCIDEALDRLASEDPTAAEVARLRLFAGISVEETAESLGVSRATAFREWSYARAWLAAALADEEKKGNP